MLFDRLSEDLELRLSLALFIKQLGVVISSLIASALKNMTLPQEVIDIIIDHLYNDPKALAACTLVSKACMKRSQYHLFSDILVNGANGRQILQPPPSLTFAPVVRRIMLFHVHRSLLPAGIEQFSSITSFYLKLSTPNADMITRMPSTFPMLASLELNEVVFRSFEHVVRLICSFPLLVTLTLHACGVQGIRAGLNTLPASLHLSRRLQTLNLKQGPVSLRVFLEWMNILPPPVSSVRVYGLVEESTVHLGAALRVWGDSLRHLTVESEGQFSASMIKHIDLSHNSNLRSISVLHGSPRDLYHLLDIFRHSQLETVRLTLPQSIDHISALKDLDWACLDHLITDLRVTNLTVGIYTRGPLQEMVIEAVKRDFLPLSAALGIVRVTPDELDKLLNGQQWLTEPISKFSWAGFISSRH